MSIPLKPADVSPPEGPFQPAGSGGTLDGKSTPVLQALMEFYESDQILDEVESEIDLMIQLSGMVRDHMQSTE